MSQIAVYSQTSGPGSGTVTSVSGGTGIIITGNPAINPTVNLVVPVVIANGGTNATSFATVDGVVYYDGTSLVTTSAGVAGQILTSQGPGLPPVYAANSGGSITLNADVGSAVGDPLTIAGGHDINTSAAGTTVTIALNNAITLGDLVSIVGSNALSAATGDINVASGNIKLTNTNSAGTTGIISYGGSRFISNFGTGNTFIGAGSGNTTLTVGSAVSNVALGPLNLASLTTGDSNTVIGFHSGLAISTGAGNTVLGVGSATSLLSGSYNTIVGEASGTGYVGAESHNILIRNAGTAAESNVIRIGTQGAGTGQQNTCFIAGITGVTTSNSQMVTLNTSTGQLGAATIPVSALTWSVITADQSAVVNNGYVANKAGLLILTLPTTSAVGSLIELTGMNTALGWQIAQNANQIIHFGNVNTTTGVAGSLASTLTYDAVRIVCNVANLEWIVLSSQGNITYV